MAKFPDPPIRTPFTGTFTSNIRNAGSFSSSAEPGKQTPAFPWTKWFQTVSTTFSQPLDQWPAGAPSTSTGQPGQPMAYDANFLYVCVAVNTWKRIPLNSF